jgi:hypothetical protein
MIEVMAPGGASAEPMYAMQRRKGRKKIMLPTGMLVTCDKM